MFQYDEVTGFLSGASNAPAKVEVSNFKELDRRELSNNNRGNQRINPSAIDSNASKIGLKNYKAILSVKSTLEKMLPNKKSSHDTIKANEKNIAFQETTKQSDKERNKLLERLLNSGGSKGGSLLSKLLTGAAGVAAGLAAATGLAGLAGLAGLRGLTKGRTKAPIAKNSKIKPTSKPKVSPLKALSVKIAKFGALIMSFIPQIRLVMLGVTAALAVATVVSKYGVEIKNKLKEFYADGVDFLTKQYKDARSIIVDTFNSTLKSVSDTVIENLKPITDFFTDFFGEMKKKIADIIPDSIKEKYESVKNAVTGAYNSAKESVSSLYSDSKTKVISVTDKVSEKYNNAKEVATETYQDAKKSVTEVTTNVKDSVLSTLKDTVKGTKSTIDEIFGYMKDKVSSMGSAVGSTMGLSLGASSPTIGNAPKGSFLSKLGKVESGNKYDITNKYGYSGKYQFGKKTATPYLKKLGVSWEQYKKSPEIQEKMIRMFMADNKKALISSGIEPTELNMWMAHNQGIGGTKQILSGNISKNVRRNISTNIGKGVAPTPTNYISRWSKTFSANKLVGEDGTETAQTVAYSGNVPSLSTVITPTAANKKIAPKVETGDKMEQLLKLMIAKDSQSSNIFSELLGINKEMLGVSKKTNAKPKENNKKEIVVNIELDSIKENV